MCPGKQGQCEQNNYSTTRAEGCRFPDRRFLAEFEPEIRLFLLPQRRASDRRLHVAEIFFVCSMANYLLSHSQSLNRTIQIYKCAIGLYGATNNNNNLRALKINI